MGVADLVDSVVVSVEVVNLHICDMKIQLEN